jgi:hypothetical protein
LSVPDTPINPEAAATEDAFTRFRFAGGRFDSHTIPLEVLPDLAAYRKLVVEVAKMLFRGRMGTRVRVPKGFEDSFQIGLARIEGGRSAVAYMPRLRHVAAHPPQKLLNFAANQPVFDQSEYPDFDDARDYIDNLIDTVGSTGSVPPEFPVELAGLFNSFGQGLLEGEFIELGFGGAKPVRYDTLIRKKIVLSRETIYENAVDAQFMLNGGVVAQGTIHVLDGKGGGFDFQPSTEFEFKKAYGRASENVRLVGTGLYDKNDRLRRLLSVNVIYSEGGATQPFESRLEEIRATPAGWYDDENPAPSPSAIEAMRSFLVDVSMQPVPLPHLYPLPSGGIAAEWTIGAWEASAEVDETGFQMTLNAVNTNTGEDVDTVIDLSSTELMSQFVTFMSAMSTDEETPDAN